MAVNNYKYQKPKKIDWLNAIPTHWEEVRLGSLFNQRKEKVSDIDYPALSVTKKGVVPQLDNAAKSNDGDNRKLVLKGDFAINSRSDRKGSSGVSVYNGSVSLIYIVLKPIKIEPRYSEYLLKSFYFKEEYYRYGRGIVEDLWTTRYSEMKNMIIPSAPIEEQTAIANFLDYKLEKIARFIKKKKQLVSLLTEQKAAIINQAVTKGINPNPKLKSSHIEWLGDIPANWEVRKLKYSVRLNSHTAFEKSESIQNKIALENIESKTGRILPLNENPFEGTGTIFKKGDVLFGKLRPYLAKVVTPNFEGSCVNELLVLSPNKEDWFSEFLKYRMLAGDFIQKGQDLDKCLSYLMQGLIIKRNSQEIDLAKPLNLPIATIIELLTKHFNAKYTADGASRLPVLALFAAYECLMKEAKRFEGKTLLEIESHTSADIRSGRIGDIDIVDDKGKEFEAVEVKHGIQINSQLVKDAFEKFKTTQVNRYYLLSTADIDPTETEKIDTEIERIKNIHGCHVIANGLINSLKYYLRLLSETSEFISNYVDLIESDTALKYEHKKKWNEIISAM